MKNYRISVSIREDQQTLATHYIVGENLEKLIESMKKLLDTYKKESNNQ